jgi:hypothetical protein
VIFSIRLDDRDVISALERKLSERGASVEDGLAFLEKEVAAALSCYEESGARVWVDRRKRRLYLSLPQSSTGGPRPQDVVAAALGLAHPSFYLTREGFIPAGRADD